jgi:COP9 signalosome complex subunit 1
LDTNFDHFDSNFVLAPVNIAVYGSLCALATYTRQELATQLINSASFKQFSELDPQLRDAVAKFYESKYAACLAILQEVRNTLMLDMYLAPHVDRLYRLIRNKALIQYFEPYSSACMRRMASSFSTSIEELEKEVIVLIYEGYIKARIDSHQKILYAKNLDPREQTFERAIKMGKIWQRQTQAMISRTAIINAGIEVTPVNSPI